MQFQSSQQTSLRSRGCCHTNERTWTQPAVALKFWVRSTTPGISTFKGSKSHNRIQESSGRPHINKLLSSYITRFVEVYYWLHSHVELWFLSVAAKTKTLRFLTSAIDFNNKNHVFIITLKQQKKISGTTCGRMCHFGASVQYKNNTLLCPFSCAVKCPGEMQLAFWGQSGWSQWQSCHN